VNQTLQSTRNKIILQIIMFDWHSMAMNRADSANVERFPVVLIENSNWENYRHVHLWNSIDHCIRIILFDFDLDSMYFHRTFEIPCCCCCCLSWRIKENNPLEISTLSWANLRWLVQFFSFIINAKGFAEPIVIFQWWQAIINSNMNTK